MAEAIDNSMIGDGCAENNRFLEVEGVLALYSDRVAEDLETMLKMDVYMDPLLVNTCFRDSMHSQVHAVASDMVQRMYARYVKIEEFSANLGDTPFSTKIMQRCLLETLLSTAISISYQVNGSVIPNKEHLAQAATNIHNFLEQCGVDGLYMLYFVIAGHDVVHPLYYYNGVSESDFLDGFSHHPYKQEVLDTFLLLGIARRSLRLKMVGGHRVVQLTKLGVARYEWTQRAFEETGFTTKRMNLSYVYQFDLVRDWDEICNEVWPSHVQLRREFIQWAKVRLGTNVLEVACGTGTLTFEGGLAEAVGEGGKFLAVDVSAGMLEQAKLKQALHGFPPQVEFRQASVESLPFPDRTFDYVLGSSFLHFTDASRALQEMARVTSPGGTVAVLQGLQFSLDRPFFQEWFEPVYELARKRHVDRSYNYLPEQAQVRQWFKDAGLRNPEVRLMDTKLVFDNPDVVVQYLVRGMSFFQTELLILPWDYRRTMINELIDRGRDVCRKYPLSERTVVMPTVMVKGRR